MLTINFKMTLWETIWFWIINCLSMYYLGVCCQSSESELIYKLLEGYHNNAKPSQDLVNVSVSLYIGSLHEILEKNQMVKTLSWVDMQWTDERLIWDPSQYNGTELLVLNQQNIWTPDIVIYNSAEDLHGSLRDEKFRAEVKSSGLVRIATAGNYITVCDLDLTFFPFDSQVCLIDLSSWSYTSDMVCLHSPSDTFLVITPDNPQWTIFKTEVKRHIWDDDDNATYDSLFFYFHVKRKPLYYLNTLVLPMILLSLLALLMFCLPADSGEKVSLGITLLLAFTVFQILLSENMPRTSDQLPLLGYYIESVMILSGLSLTGTVVVLNIHHQSEQRPVPLWLHRLTFNVIAKIICMGHLPIRHDITDKTEMASDQQMDNEKCKIKTDTAKTGTIVGHKIWQEVALVYDRFFFVLGFTAVVVINVVLFVIYPLHHPQSALKVDDQ